MNLSIDDRGEADIDSHNSPPSGSEGTFTNSTLRIDSWTSPFDWAATVSDWFSRTSSAFNVNFTAIDNGLQEDDYSHDLSTQQVNRTVDLNNPGPNSADYDITLNPEGTTVKNGNTSGTVSSGNTVSTTGVWSGDWLSSVTEGTYLEQQNTSKSSDTGTQYLFNQTNLSVTNSKSFQFSSVDISSQCSIDTAADVPGGTNEVTQKCNNESHSGDWIDETEHDFAPQSNEVTLGVNYIGDRNLELTDNKGVSWTDVNTTSGVTTPNGCSQTNNTQVNLSASATSNFTIEMSCDPGDISGDLTQQQNKDDNNDTWYWWNSTSVDIKSNETENTTLLLKLSESDDLNDWDSRKAGDEELYCNGEKVGSNNWTFTDPANFVRVKFFANSSCGSSLTTATDSIGFKYEVGDEDTTEVSDGSSGGGGGSRDDEDDDLGAELLPSQPYRVSYGLNVTETLTIRNYKNEENRVDLEIDPRRGDACEYFRLQEVTTGSVDDVGRISADSRGEFGDSGFVRVPPASAGLTGSSSEIPAPIEIRMPNEETFNRVANENGSLTCRVSATAGRGVVNDVVLKVEPQTNPFAWLFDLIGQFTDAMFQTFSTTQQTCFGENNTALLTNGTQECPETAQETRRMPNRAGAVLIITVLVIGLTVLIYRHR